MKCTMRTVILLTLSLLACPDPAKDKTKAVVAPAASAPMALVPLEGAAAYRLDLSASSIGFTGAKVTGKHEGGFKQFRGALEVVQTDLGKSRLTVDVDVSSVFTDNERLTGHLKSADFFDAERLPSARFVSSSLTAKEVSGDFTLHGVTRRLTFPAVITLTDASFDATAEFSINRKDFGIVYAAKADDLIADNVLLKLHLVGQR